MQIFKSLFAVSVMLGLPGIGHAALHDRGGGLIYDDILDVTWLAKSSDTFVTWQSAFDWADGLEYVDSVRGVTWSDWRLPTVAPVDGNAFVYTDTFNGTTDRGYNIAAPGTLYAGSTASELAHLFFVSLGNLGICDPATSTATSCGSAPAGWGFVNRFTFDIPVSALGSTFWTGTDYPPGNGSFAWYFSLGSGQQFRDYKGTRAFALALRDGDVGLAPIPEAETYALMLAEPGVGPLGSRLRRYRV